MTSRKIAIEGAVPRRGAEVSFLNFQNYTQTGVCKLPTDLAWNNIKRNAWQTTIFQHVVVAWSSPANISIKQHKSFWKAQWGRQHFVLFLFRNVLNYNSGYISWLFLLQMTSDLWKGKLFRNQDQIKEAFFWTTKEKKKLVIREHLKIWVKANMLLQ